MKVYVVVMLIIVGIWTTMSHAQNTTSPSGAAGGSGSLANTNTGMNWSSKTNSQTGLPIPRL